MLHSSDKFTSNKMADQSFVRDPMISEVSKLEDKANKQTKKTKKREKNRVVILTKSPS